MLFDLFLTEDSTPLGIQADSKQSCHHIPTLLSQSCRILWKSDGMQSDYGKVYRVLIPRFIL